ncbi:MAG: ATP-binding protein [Planctomycetes bacterium]|nr:ATP-binding protein [Planctomycetota bacterium]
MARTPNVLVLAKSAHWPETRDAAGAGTERSWREAWNEIAEPAPGHDLVVVPEGIALAAIAAWREAAPASDLLLVAGAGDERLMRFFGDQRVFYLQPVADLADVRAGIEEVLSYRACCETLADGGKQPPPAEVERPVVGWLELTGPSHPVFLRRFRAWVETLGGLGLDREEHRKLLHAVREIGWNALEWGNRFTPERRLSLSYLLLEDRILFRIESEGQSRDWYEPRGKVPDPAELQRRRAARGVRPGGLGLVLVRSVVDRIDVSSHGRIVILEKRVRPLLAGSAGPALPRVHEEHA